MSGRVNKKIFTGTSGIVTPVPRDLYPPEFQGKSRLEFYASLYNSIEINSSFYKLPMAATVRKWESLVPDGFRFTFKLSKAVTHAKGLNFDPADVHRFMETITISRNKKGCILIQFPPGQQNHVMKLREIFTLIRNEDPEQQWSIAVEF